jgi:hypothetical protein
VIWCGCAAPNHALPVYFFTDFNISSRYTKTVLISSMPIVLLAATDPVSGMGVDEYALAVSQIEISEKSM